MPALSSLRDFLQPLPVAGHRLRIYRFMNHDVITPYDCQRESEKNSFLFVIVLIAVLLSLLTYCVINKHLTYSLIVAALIIFFSLIACFGTDNRFVFDYLLQVYYKTEDPNVGQLDPQLGGSFDEIETLVLRRVPSRFGFSSYELALNRRDGVQVEVMHHETLHEDLYADVVKLSDRLGLPISNNKGDIIYNSKRCMGADTLQHYIAPNILNTRERWRDKIILALASLLIALNIYSIWLNLSDNNPPHISESFSQTELTEWFIIYYQTEQTKTEYPNNLHLVEKIVAAPAGKGGIDVHVRYYYLSVNENFSMNFHADNRYRVRINERGDPRTLFSVIDVGEPGSSNFLLSYTKKLYEKWL